MVVVVVDEVVEVLVVVVAGAGVVVVVAGAMVLVVVAVVGTPVVVAPSPPLQEAAIRTRAMASLRMSGSVGTGVPLRCGIRRRDGARRAARAP